MYKRQNQYGEQGFWGFPGAGARHTIYDQYAFAGIDQDGGGDIDVVVVYPDVYKRQVLPRLVTLTTMLLRMTL